MTHTNFKTLIPAQTRREVSDPPRTSEGEAGRPETPGRRTADRDFYDAYAEVHAALTGAVDGAFEAP